MKKCVPLGVAVLAVALLWTSPALAQNNRHAFRVTGGYFVPTDEVDIRDTEPGDEEPDPAISTENEFRNTYGASLSYEFRATQRIGINFSASYFKPKVKLPFLPFEDKVKFIPVSAGVMFHLGSSERFDFYFGPQVTYINYGGINAPSPGFPEVFDFDNETTWGGRAGLDIPFSPNIALNISAEFIAAKAKLKSTTADYEIKPRPAIVNVGATFRF